MKKIFKKISYALSTFVLGAQTKIFAADKAIAVYGPAPDPKPTNTIFDPGQTDIYGPAPDPGPAQNVLNPGRSQNIFDPNQTDIYGPAPDPIRTATGLGPGQILSILVSVVLFVLGITIALNKGIKKNVKVISISIISIVIVVLMILTIFVFN